MAVPKKVRGKPAVRPSKRAEVAERKSAACAVLARGGTEQALRDNEARLGAVLETAVDGIITIDERGLIESFNQAAERLFGYRAGEVMGRNIHVLMPSPHREQHDRYLANYRATGERKIIGIGREVSGRRKDGSTFPVELAVSEVQLGARRIFTGIVRDISRRKQAEEALRDQMHRYQSLVEVSPDAIFVLQRSRIVFINPEGVRLFGAESSAQLLGKSPFEFFRRSRHEIIRQRIDLTAEFEGASPLIDEELVRLDGSTRWVTLLSAMFTDHGETAVQFILRDITERKRLENEILEISDHEQRRIGQDLHDGLGQQLTAIELMCHSLREDLATGHPLLEKQAATMCEMLREAVGQTRALSHGLAPVNLEAGGLMTALGELARTTSTAGKVKCRFHCVAPVLIADRAVAGHLYRIAQEAVNNALKHGRPHAIGIELNCHADVVRLCITDDGKGFSQSRKRGDGMGLEVMRHRANIMGATLDILSPPGQGVTVECNLPLLKS